MRQALTRCGILCFDDTDDFQGPWIDNDDFRTDQEIVIAAPSRLELDNARGKRHETHRPWDPGADPHVEICVAHARRGALVHDHVVDPRALLDADVEIGPGARRALAGRGAIVALVDRGTFVGAILIEPALGGSVLIPPLVLRSLAGGLVAAAILLRPLAILLCLAALVPIAILKLALARGFAAAAILLRSAAPIAVAILKLALAGGFATAAVLLRLATLIAVTILELALTRGFATAAILLRCTTLVPLGRTIPCTTLILLQAAGRLVAFLLLRITDACGCDHADGCGGNEKPVPVLWKPHRKTSFGD